MLMLWRTSGVMLEGEGWAFVHRNISRKQTFLATAQECPLQVHHCGTTASSFKVIVPCSAWLYEACMFSNLTNL